MQALNAPQDVIESYRTEPEGFELLAENWDAVSLFRRCSTQWRYAPNGTPIGFDYPGVEVVMKRLKVKRKSKVFAQLQTMEQITLRELEKRQ